MKSSLICLCLVLGILFTSRAADSKVCPQFKSMDNGDGTAFFYSLRCPETQTPCGYTQASTGPIFSGCQLNCPPLSFTLTEPGKHSLYEADEALQKTGVGPSKGFTVAASTKEFEVEKFHPEFVVQLKKEDKAFKHQGKDVFAEVIGLKITPKGKKSQYFFAGRQLADAPPSSAPATVMHHATNGFLVHFECELPDLVPLRATGQLMLLK